MERPQRIDLEAVPPGRVVPERFEPRISLGPGFGRLGPF
jgi:hypothetical protein